MAAANRFLVSAIFVLIFSSILFAHQPRWVSQNLTIIENPEVSQAFYGILDGSPDYFQIDSAGPFSLYVDITIPDLPGASKDVNVEIVYYDTNNFKNTIRFNGSEAEWTPFYEEFGDDYYFQGPGIKADASYGICTIKVYSSESNVKYALAIGEKEEFPLNEIINTISLMPKIKSDFFNKSPFTAFFNRIGLFIFGPVIIPILLILLVVWAYKRITKQKKAKQKSKRKKK